MPEHQQLLMVLYILLGSGALIGGLKGIDWLIGQKYVSHLKCEKCRNEILTIIATDHDLLREVDTKVDLLLDNFDLKK